MRECPRCERCYEDETLLCPDDEANTKLTLPGGPLLAGRYLIEKRLGRGAMGQVYLARDENLKTRHVAIKTIRPEVLLDEGLQEGEAIARFEREARTAASVRHPNVVDVTDFGKSPEGVFYLVMEYVQGETLHHLLRREGTLSVQRTLSLLQQICAGVDAAHDEGILHRDLKPANIFIMQRKRKDGSLTGEGFVKVGDFGLAKIVGGALDGLDSASGPASRGIIGTPEYMAPEQMQPGVKLDARADIYALGTIAYHMLGGRPPFTGDITQIIMQKVMNTPPPLSTLRSDISAEVEHGVMHALEKEMEARPANVGEWMEELEKAAGKSAEEQKDEGETRVVVLAPVGAEVYVDDERHGSIGRSGRIILNSVPPGRHVLRVSRTGERDDERVIEIRPDASEQIIQAQLKPPASANQQSPSRGGSIGLASGPGSVTPSVVACARCGARFASGVKFCGRCGSTSFNHLNEEQDQKSLSGGVGSSSNNSPSSINVQPGGGARCGRCGHVYPAGTRFCGRCGIPIASGLLTWNAPQPVEVFCNKCGTSYPSGTRFCGRCGIPIRA